MIVELNPTVYRNFCATYAQSICEMKAEEDVTAG